MCGGARRWCGDAVVWRRCGSAVTQYGGLACQRADKAEDERGGPCREEGGTGAEEHEGAYARCAQPLQGEQAWRVHERHYEEAERRHQREALPHQLCVHEGPHG